MVNNFLWTNFIIRPSLAIFWQYIVHNYYLELFDAEWSFLFYHFQLFSVPFLAPPWFIVSIKHYYTNLNNYIYLLLIWDLLYFCWYSHISCSLRNCTTFWLISLLKLLKIITIKMRLINLRFCCIKLLVFIQLIVKFLKSTLKYSYNYHNSSNKHNYTTYWNFFGTFNTWFLILQGF